MAKKKKEKKKVSQRFILFFIILAFVIVIIAFGNKIGGGSLLRIAYLIGDGITGTAEETTIRFDSNNSNRFHAINGGFAVLSVDGMHIYNLDGEERNFTPLNYHSPSLAGGKKMLVAYDRNGHEYTVMDKDGVLYNGKADAPIINITMNENGDFTVTTAGPDCKALVSVYDSDFELLYRVHSSEQYVLSAPVSEDGDKMATLGFSASTGQFAGRITFYDLDKEDPLASRDLVDIMPLNARFLKNGELILLTESSLLRINNKGEVASEIPFDGFSITNASLDSRNIGAVLLDTQGRGNDSRLLVSTRRDDKLTYNFVETIYDVSCAGDYTALLLADRIVVYDKDGDEYHTFRLTQGIKECIMRKDGTVFAIGRNFANLLIP